MVTRDQEATIEALKASNCELRSQNDSLLSTNSGLKSHASGGSLANNNGSPGITRLRAQLDVDLSGLSVGGCATGSCATATATVPLRFDSKYRNAMERGM